MQWAAALESVMGLPRGLRKSKSSSRPQNNRIEIASTPIASCSTNSPPWFGDNSPIHSSPSPVPFLYSQDASHGEADVIWSYYSPKSRKGQRKFIETPVRRRRELAPSTDFSPVSRLPMKRRSLRQARTKKDFLKDLKEELLVLNKHVQEVTSAKVSSAKETNPAKCPSPDIFKESPTQPNKPIDNVNNEQTPKCKMEPLKSYISEKISKCDNEGIESDDSMNEFLLKASQMVEENLENKSKTLKIPPIPQQKNNVQSDKSCSKVSKQELLNFNNDSFDNLISNINDSYIETLTQKCSYSSSETEIEFPRDINKNFQLKNKENCLINSTFSEINNIVSSTNVGTDMASTKTQLDNSFTLNDGPLNESKSKFCRHKSMPTSNNPYDVKKPISSFGRHNSMPFSSKSNENILDSFGGDIRDEIRRKREAAREKLLSKNRNSKISSQVSSQIINDGTIVETFSSEPFRKNLKSDTLLDVSNKLNTKKDSLRNNKSSKDLLIEIERKRKEALEKLQKKRLQNGLKRI